MDFRSLRNVLPPIALALVVAGISAQGPGNGLLNPEATDVAPIAELPPAPIVSSGSGGPEREAVDPEIRQLQNELQAILTSTGNARGLWGVLAVSLDRNDTLLALNPARPMVPASNMKLFTTAAALHFLGPEFRYRTFVLEDGPRKGDELEGDLILYGTGDPTFSGRFHSNPASSLDSLAAMVRAGGLRRIRGDLVVDGSFFREPYLHPDWKPEDLNDAFAAPVAALSMEENLITVRVEAGSWVGAQPVIYTSPPRAGIPVDNLAHTAPAGSRSRIWLLREDPRDPIGIIGEIPIAGRDVWRRLPVPDPLRFTGLQLKWALEARGVEVQGRVVPVRSPSLSRISASGPEPGAAGGTAPRILAILDSPPLLDVLRVINKESNNFLAETVVKTLGRVVFGEGSFAAGSRAVQRFLVEEVGAPNEEIRVRDGSGLSAENRTSAGVLVRTLAHMSESPGWNQFLETLPEAGARRELRRMYRSPAAGNLRAKTGTMDRVSALSGMVRTRSGERILFSILSNEVRSEYRAKRAEDRLGIRLASLSRPYPP